MLGSTRRIPLRLLFVLMAALVLVVVCAGVLVLYARAARIVVDRTYDYVDDVFLRTQQSVMQACTTFSRLLVTVAYNPTVQLYILESDPRRKYEYNTSMRAFLALVVAFTDGIMDVAVLPSRGPGQSTGAAAQFLARVPFDPAPSSRPTFSGLIDFGEITDDRRHPAILLYVTAYSALQTQYSQYYGQPLGTVALVLDPGVFIPRDPGVAQNIPTRFYVLDRLGQVLAGHDEVSQPREFPARSADPRMLVQSAALPVLGGTILAVTDRFELLRDLGRLRNAMVAVLGVAIGTLTVVLLLLLGSISRPILELTRFIARAKEQDLRAFPERVAIGGFAEISVMAREFNSMLDEIGRLTDRLLAANAKVYEAELLKRESELSMLQSQINPHFLYNTLETIAGMAHAEGSATIVQTTESLSRIFKYAVKARDMVPLSEEVEMLRSYLRIQQLRFGDRFTVQYEIDPHALPVKVPKMILQPIVENAIVHGLEALRSGGEVRVAARVHDGALIVQVHDNGAGMTPQVLDELSREMAVAPAGSPEHRRRPMGLKNVNERLLIIFGSRAHLAIDSGAGRGTTVSITIPLEATVG